MKICNIITEDSLKYDSIINKKENFSDSDSEKPTLIIGWKNAKKIVGEKFSILNKRIDNNLFWTFSKSEKRSEYIDDLNNFYRYTISYYLNKIKYKYFNLFLAKYSNIKSFLNYIDTVDKNVYICDNKMIYFYSGGDIVVGISLKDIFYFKVSYEKIIKRITENRNNRIVTNLKMKKEIINIIRGNDYLIPFLLS